MVVGDEGKDVNERNIQHVPFHVRRRAQYVDPRLFIDLSGLRSSSSCYAARFEVLVQG
jgi:hypothetical protein